MPPLAVARFGKVLKIKERKLDFSFWPMGRSTRRFGLQSRIFATDPWSVIRHSINTRCPAASKIQAQAFRAQAEDYFRAARVGGLFTTKPVLLYYSFLNLEKAFVLTVGRRVEYGAAYHGLSEKLPTGGVELLSSSLEARPSGSKINIYDDFLTSLTGVGLAGQTTYQLTHILPQLLQGHRLWASAADELERFIEVARIDIMQDSTTKSLWTVLNFFEDDLTRLDISHGQLMEGARLNGDYREVRSDETVGERKLLKFEQITPLTYLHRPSDRVPALVDGLKHKLWANVLSVPPYRKYYVYVAPLVERSSVLPQLASISSFFFYLGSVTRYKPQKLEALLQGSYGAQLEEAVINLPNQFLFLMASEFSRQDVTRAAIV